MNGAAAGSGYLIGPRLVLTSAHVVGMNTPAVTVIRPGRSGEFEASVVWCGVPDGDTDAALVHVTAPDWPMFVLEQVMWGRTVTHQPGIACVTWGLPSFVQRPGAPVEVEQPTGTLNPGDGFVGDRYVVKLNGHPPNDGTESPWRGISGAAVFCGDLLAGVVAADPAHRSHAALVVVPAYMLLRDQGFLDVVERLGERGVARCEPIELQDQMDHQSPVRATATVTPASLLVARRAVVPFRGREQALAELVEWAAQPGLGVWLLHGPGGQGKTRLAHYFGERLAADGWAVLWLNVHATGDQLRPVRHVSVPLLVVVDYAETRTGQLVEMFNALAARASGPVVKVLLLARVVGDWWEQVAAGSESAADAVGAVRITTLEPLDATQQARENTYLAAVHAFSDTLPHLDSTCPTDTDWSAAAAAVVNGPLPVFGWNTTALGVQMYALVALLDATAPTPSPGGRSLEDRVLIHERRYWDATAASHSITALGPATLKDIIAATVALAPATFSDIETVLARIPDLTDQPAIVRSNTRDWLMSLYPGQTPGVFGGLAPDRVAERLVGRLMLDHTRPCIIETLAIDATLTNTETEHLLTVCTRAAGHSALTPAGNRLTDWCVRHARKLMPAAIRTATRTETPAPLLAALDHFSNNPTSIDTDTLLHLHDCLPTHTQVLADAAVSLTGALVDRLRRMPNSTAADQNLRAAIVSNFANRLGNAGRLAEALAAATEAVEIRRQLADKDDAFLPDLAGSVNNLAVGLAAVGRHTEALAAATEAVALYRRLADQYPGAFLPELATSVNTLAIRLSKVRRRDEAVTAVAEAVLLFRQLADQDATFQLHLATSVHNFACRLGEAGRVDEGLAVAANAVALYRGLADQHPDAFLPGLAASINTLAVGLAAAGTREEALEAATEAVALYRGLADRHPDAFLPEFAMCMDNLASELWEAGQRDDALAVAAEAVALYRGLADRHPDAFLPEFAMCVHNFAVRLGESGPIDDALAAATEAIGLYERLAAQYPQVYDADLDRANLVLAILQALDVLESR
ncbi:tetratricopeptide repeat protein [Nocardia sp. NPDC052278]|uniref:tetratricopeptide repeat protein n=1 Tax=unclassified Nocardia TaxID=2637762 RepID=UPI0036B525F4